MTDLDTIVSDVINDPARLDDYDDDDLRVILDLKDQEDRRTVAEVLRQGANRNPEIVGRHTKLLRRVLTDDDETVCEDGIHAVAVVTETHPEAVASLVSELLTALIAADDSVARASAVRALATIGDETEVSVSEGDEIFATLLRDDAGVRDEVATNMGIIVIEHPDDFPQTLQAYVDALTDTDPEVRTFAMKTLAVVARNDVDVVPDIAVVESHLKDLRNDYPLDSDEVEQAIEMVQQAVDGGSG